MNEEQIKGESDVIAAARHQQKSEIQFEAHFTCFHWIFARRQQRHPCKGGYVWNVLSLTIESAAETKKKQRS